MSAPTNDGGPAFPMPSGPANAFEHGMTLRDYFAAAALTGLLANTDTDGSRPDFARWSYDYADAMLAARGGVA